MRAWVLVMLLLAAPLPAVEKLKVMALFSDRAMINIDGRNRLLHAGKTSPEGVRLIRADSHEAVIELDGVRQTLKLGKGVAASYRKRERVQQRIVMGNDGAYTIQGMINGHAVPMVVDTGANTVALSAEHAAGMGINYLHGGKAVLVQTASGMVKGYDVNLASVRAGSIELRNVPAVVIEGSLPEKVLLGMSFLSRLHIQNKGNLMVLTKSH
ncbi:retropepsin-like aspartic protease family protein [Thiolapillus sp.]